MTNVTPCCCDDNNGIGLAVGGSGSDKSADTNVPNLHLYYAELEDTCLPCNGKTIHGTMEIPYKSSREIFSKIHRMFVGYSETEDTYTLSHFPELGLIKNPKSGKYELSQEESVYIFIEHSEGTGLYKGQKYFTFKDFIEKAKSLPKGNFKGHVFKPCDCFTDVLYISKDKTEDENAIAEIQKLYCDYYRIGVNALHLQWKPSVYLGEHDSKVEGISACGPIHIESDRRGFVQDCTSRPQSTQHVRSIFLPKNFKGSGITFPSFNIKKLWYGPDHDDKILENDPKFWPNQKDVNDTENVIFKGADHSTIYLLYTYMFRVLFTALSFSSMKYSLYEKEIKKQPWFHYIDPPSFGEFSTLETLNIMRNPTLGEHRTPICCTVQGISGPAITGATYYDCDTNEQHCDGNGQDFPDPVKCESVDTTGKPPPIITVFDQPVVYNKSSTSKNKGFIYYAFGCIPEICYVQIPPVDPSFIIGNSCGSYVKSLDILRNCLCQDTYFYGGFVDSIGRRKCYEKYAYYDFTTFNFSLSDKYIIPFKIKNYSIRHKILVPQPESFQDYPTNPKCNSFEISCNTEPDELTYEKTSVPYYWWSTNGGSNLINSLLTNTNYSNEEKYRFITNTNFKIGVKQKTALYNKGKQTVCAQQCCGTQQEIGCVRITDTVVYDAVDNSITQQQTRGSIIKCEDQSCVTCPGCEYDVKEEWSDCNYDDDSAGGCTKFTITEKYCIPEVIGEKPNECKETITDSCGNDVPVCKTVETPRIINRLVDAETWIPNPFLFFNIPHLNYQDVLLKIGKAWSIKQKLHIDDSANICNTSPFTECSLDSCYNNIYLFSEKDYLQSKLTKLYGKKLEYGSLQIEYLYPDGDTSWFNDLIEYPSDYLTSSFTIGIDFWPQAIPAQTNQTDIVSNKDNKSYIIEILKNRKSFHPDDSFRIALGPPNQTDYERYWTQRVVYELADTFQIEGKVISDIKSEYYKDGIPDLSYTKTKLAIFKTGKISKQESKEYKLNWFDVSIQNIINIAD